MKTQRHFALHVGAGILMAAWLGAIVPVHSAPAEENSRTPASETDGNTIPKSVFIVPANPLQGRDPFFPNSTRLAGIPVVQRQPAPAVALVYNGLSGTPDHKLAIISGHTFAEGETAEVNTSDGRIKVHCVEIKGDSVVVEVNGQRRELRFRSDN